MRPPVAIPVPPRPACPNLSVPIISTHAVRRMAVRRITRDEVDLVLSFGRLVHVRGAEIYAVGRREIATLKDSVPGIEKCSGVQVVCTSSEGVVMTAYRNNDFRSLKPRHRRNRVKTARRG